MLVEFLVCEISSSWKGFSGNAVEYYNKKYKCKGGENASVYDLVYNNKYKELSEEGINMIKAEEYYLSLDNIEEIEILKKDVCRADDIINYIINYTNNFLSWDKKNKIYYLNKTPIGAIDHCLPVYVNLNKDFLKQLTAKLFI